MDATLKNGFKLNLQIESENESTTDECIYWLGMIEKNKLPKWSEEKKKNTRLELIDLIDWRNALVPLIVNYIDNFGMNFPSDLYFYSNTLDDKRFIDYTPLVFQCGCFGFDKNTIEIKLKVS